MKITKSDIVEIILCSIAILLGTFISIILGGIER